VGFFTHISFNGKMDLVYFRSPDGNTMSNYVHWRRPARLFSERYSLPG